MRRQRRFAEQTVGQWTRGAKVKYNVSWPSTSIPIQRSVGRTSAELLDKWQASTEYEPVQRAGPLHPRHLHPVQSSYIQDISLVHANVREAAAARLESVLPAALVRGQALQHCTLKTDGVHRPSFYLLRCSDFALENDLGSAAVTEVHNESQRLGFWHHLLPSDALDWQQERLTRPLTSAAEYNVVARRQKVTRLYKLYGTLTKLRAGADAFAPSVYDNLSRMVSTSWGELGQASVDRLVEAMLEHGPQSDDVVLDVGSGYGRLAAHVALRRGVSVMGVEAVPDRHETAKHCLVDATAHKYDLAGVRLHIGNVLDNIHLLLPATHVIMFDARFPSDTRAILRSLLPRLAGSRLRMVVCEEKPNDPRRRAALGPRFDLLGDLGVTTNMNDFHLSAFLANDQPHSDAVEVAVLSGGRLGVRARREVRAGEVLLTVEGRRLSNSEWKALAEEACDTGRRQWMLQREGEWLHVLNIARFVNCPAESSSTGSGQVNARYAMSADGDTVLLRCCQTVAAGEEVVACRSQEDHSLAQASVVLPLQCFRKSCPCSHGC